MLHQEDHGGHGVVPPLVEHDRGRGQTERTDIGVAQRHLKGEGSRALEDLRQEREREQVLRMAKRNAGIESG